MPTPLNLPCSTCAGRRYVRTPHGWTACATCYVSLANSTYIKPQVKQGETEVPPGPAPWDLTDRFETGSYSDFRHQVWRSLLHYYSARVSYEYVEGWRLVEIQFRRDPEYATVQTLRDFDLVVIVVGLADPYREFTGQMVRNLQNLRKMYGKPTWTFDPAPKRTPERRATPETPPTKPANLIAALD